MLRKQIKFTCIALQLLTWRMKELMGNITDVCRIWDKHQFLMTSLNLMPGLKLCVLLGVRVRVCGVIFEVSPNGALLMRWGQRAALTIMGSSDFLTHTPGVSPCVILYFLSFIAFLHHSLHLIPSLSFSLTGSFIFLPPSLPRSPSRALFCVASLQEAAI